MEINPAGAVGLDTTAQAATDQTLGQEAFLQLLVAQLKYQDPMSPADSQSFLAQTAQFTTVETLEEIAGSIADANLNAEMATIGAIVGQHAEYLDGAGNVRRDPIVSARTTPEGIAISTPVGELLLGDVLAIVAPSEASP